MKMSSENERKTIAWVQHPDGSLSAHEEIIQFPTDNEDGRLEASATLVPGTERYLPISREEAEKWVQKVMGDAPDDDKEGATRMLCGEDRDWVT